jgi:hypothetical protein
VLSKLFPERMTPLQNDPQHHHPEAPPGSLIQGKIKVQGKMF